MRFLSAVISLQLKITGALRQRSFPRLDTGLFSENEGSPDQYDFPQPRTLDTRHEIKEHHLPVSVMSKEADFNMCTTAATGSELVGRHTLLAFY